MKTFGELTREEKIKLVIAWIDGAVIELKHFTDEYWNETDHPAWASKAYYRIKPTKPSINWDHVHRDHNFLATDKDGLTALYEYKPRNNGDRWVDGGFWSEAKVFSSYRPGTCDWKESLVERPKK